jgi:purine-binding chemotaxis protein CheW
MAQDETPDREMDSHNGLRSRKSGLKKFMFLRLGQSQFAIPLSSVREVLGLSQISRIPNMPDYFEGIINLRGKVVSAISLRKSLHFIDGIKSSGPSARHQTIIIVEFDTRLYGAIVDDIVDVQGVHESQLDRSIDNLKHKDVFEGVIRRSDESLSPVLCLQKAMKLNELITSRKAGDAA